MADLLVRVLQIGMEDALKHKEPEGAEIAPVPAPMIGGTELQSSVCFWQVSRAGWHASMLRGALEQYPPPMLPCHLGR